MESPCTGILYLNSNNHWIDLFKDPITDIGKRSLKGRVTTFSNKHKYHIFAERIGLEGFNLDIEDIMVTVFKDGNIMNLPSSFSEVIEYN